MTHLEKFLSHQDCVGEPIAIGDVTLSCATFLRDGSGGGNAGDEKEKASGGGAEPRLT